MSKTKTALGFAFTGLCFGLYMVIGIWQEAGFYQFQKLNITEQTITVLVFPCSAAVILLIVIPLLGFLLRLRATGNETESAEYIKEMMRGKK